MAHKATGSAVKGAKHFWNIDKGVGWGYDNKWDDVLLIQYILNSTVGANLVDDGIFGKKTQKAIKSFQDNCALGYADGKVNAVPLGTDVWIQNSGYMFTIYLLNMKYLYEKPLLYKDLRMDPKLPSELVQIFS